ncbi:MAG TPA: peptidylprolyl isomerase [Anaeromyxobacter sp.]|nr:peptidylprolyl isomerase [Anaeromyxobacter sp.]
MTPLRPSSAARAALAALLALSVVTGCKRSSEKKAQGATTQPSAEAGAVYAVFETSRGVIGAKLLPGEAPKAVATFVELATAKKPFKDPLTKETRTGNFYDGLLFHRAEPGKWIQSGDPASRDAPLGADNAAGYNFGWTGPGFEFEDELPQPGTKLYERPCMVGLTNHGPNTNGSQFFITEVPTPQLEPQTCDRAPSRVCGWVRIGEGVCGCELVGAIARAGPSQTRLVKVTISDTPPTCQ